MKQREPYFYSAGALALAVHLVFFSVLYFGLFWQTHTRSPDAMTVEMWDSLPDTVAAPTQEAAPPQPVREEPPVRPKVTAPVLPPVKADIEVRDRKSAKALAKERAEKNAEAQAKAAAQAKAEAQAKAAAKARQEAKALQQYEANLEQARQAEQARVRAEVTAATQTQIDRYMDLIRNKIRRRMTKVPDVPDTAEAVFQVTVLPDGSLMDDPVLVKSSGYAAYDDAAERAILSAEPLPLPTDVSLLKMFRELKLSIKP